MKYPYDFNEDGELSAYEYALFMDEMEREEREMKRRRGFSPMSDDEDDPFRRFDGDDCDDEDYADDDYDDDEDWDL